MTRSALSLLWWSALGGFALCVGIRRGVAAAKTARPALRKAGRELGTQWVLDVSALGGAGSVSSWIAFARGSVSGNDGCNIVSGSYEVDGSKLTFGPLAGRRWHAAVPPTMSRAVTTRAVRRLEIRADTLRMKVADGQTR